MKHFLASILLACGGLIAHLLPAQAGESPLGHWSGTATAPGESTDIVIDVRKDGASLSLPRVGVLDWPARSSSIEGDRVVLEFQSDSGVQRMTLDAGDGILRGTWSDPRFGEAASLRMARAAPVAALREQRIRIDSAAGHLGASLILPEGPGPFPGVVFLHGSGPQPRDASRFHARELARRGIAALIFDKRGVGESSGSPQRPAFDALAADAISAANYLRAQPGITSVGFYGHSQGGWIAPLAASRWPQARFVIASSGPLVSPARESQWDVVRRMRQIGADETQVERARAAIDQWYHAMARGNWSDFDRTLQALRTEPWFAPSGLGEFAEHPNRTDASAYLMDHDYDPLPALRGMHAPALWILSADDESIDAMETMTLLEKQRAAGRDIRIKLYRGHDHTLRRLGANGQVLRWPQLPDDLFDVQAGFIKESDGRKD